MLKKLLMTGAAGGVGRALRPYLSRMAERVVLSDIVEVGELAPHESFQACELSDRAGVEALAEGVDGIIHLGGISLERPWKQILGANIEGAYNLFDAARLSGKPRIVFASSNHVTGYYGREMRIGPQMPVRPDSLYGVSKAFGEALASLYFDKFELECLTVRIGWCFPKPKDMRTQAIYLAVEDLADLCERAFTAPRLGHTIVYGVSNNDECWWDNSSAAFLGWKPKHSSALWREEMLAAEPDWNPADPLVRFQGGGFAGSGHPDDPKG
ncbi:NAD-dependent epimerase/dehydratase family protein [Solirhodobacter olei]|uniref:NAD-dependent epimerase/dehydratase family protein n=1 Tax=Solirhodobacter olei TaxID=2493082 RepID=UPI000FD9951E|nr:NAD(P)-dependent oxidoreductase [Solirhodobacter olei]